MVHPHCCDFIELERNLGVALHGDDASLTGDHLAKISAILELHRNDLSLSDKDMRRTSTPTRHPNQKPRLRSYVSCLQGLEVKSGLPVLKSIGTETCS
jgi:hypothetical protein